MSLRAVKPVGSGTPLIDISGGLIPNSTAAGDIAANTTIVQNAIIAAQNAAQSMVGILIPGVYYLNQIVMYSYTSLYVGTGVTIRKPANTAASMFINWGATQGTPQTDTDIGFYGHGTIDGNSLNQTGNTRANNGVIPVNTFLYGIQGELAMIGVNNFECEIRYPYNCNGFFVQWIGNRGRFAHMRPNTSLDFIHINGPSTHVQIEDCVGWSTDAFVALNAWDWHASGPSVGTISDVRIRDCAYWGSNAPNGVARTGCLVAALPGTRTTGYGQGVGNVLDVEVDGYHIDMGLGSVTPASSAIQPSMAADLINGSEYSGVGTIDTFVLKNGYCSIPNSNVQFIGLQSNGITADNQATLTMRNFIVENSHADASTGTTGTTCVSTGVTFSSWFIENWKFKDCEWTPATTGVNQSFLNFGNKTPADSIAFDGFAINQNGATGFTEVVLVNQWSGGNAAVINDLTVDRIQTAPGLQFASPVVIMIGVANMFRARGCYIVGSGAGSDGQGIIAFNGTTANVGYAIVQDSYFNNYKEVICASVAVATIGNIVMRNCQLTNCTHPVLNQSASAIDISYDGCSINSATNLAFCNGGATTLSYVDTVSSGAGATIINLLSGTCQVRKSDRIQLPAAMVSLGTPTPQNNDLINFAATPSYTGVGTVTGTGAGLYVRRGTGTVGWVKLN